MKHLIKIYIVLTVILITGIGNQSLACTCELLKRSKVKALIKKADFVVIGRAISNINKNEYFKMRRDEEKRGADVLFKVDSVIKGVIGKDTIYINQNYGSCTRVFEFGESYIVFGFEIKRFIKKERNDNGPDSLSPPALPVLKNSEMILDERDDKIIDFYNAQTAKYTTIRTNLCLTFYKDSEELKYIVR